MRRGMRWVLAAVALVAAVWLAHRFPWRETGAILAHVNGGLLLAALVVNLVSPLTKAWGWHLLLRDVAPSRWVVAQEANLVGMAVNAVSVGATGEAARVSFVARREQLPVRTVVFSVVASRLAEALGLACFLLAVPLGFDLSPAARAAQLAAGVLLLSAVVLFHLPTWRRRVARLLAPTAFALVNWAAQWATYYLTLRATHTPATPGIAFMALLAVNLGGLLRIAPANAGVAQAAMAAALLPFGIPAERGVAAGLALQAIQVLPILAAGLIIAGRVGFERHRLRVSTEGVTAAL